MEVVSAALQACDLNRNLPPRRNGISVLNTHKQYICTLSNFDVALNVYFY